MPPCTLRGAGRRSLLYRQSLFSAFPRVRPASCQGCYWRSACRFRDRTLWSSSPPSCKSFSWILIFRDVNRLLFSIIYRRGFRGNWGLHSNFHNNFLLFLRLFRIFISHLISLPLRAIIVFIIWWRLLINYRFIWLSLLHLFGFYCRYCFCVNGGMWKDFFCRIFLF